MWAVWFPCHGTRGEAVANPSHVGAEDSEAEQMVEPENSESEPSPKIWSSEGNHTFWAGDERREWAARE